MHKNFKPKRVVLLPCKETGVDKPTALIVPKGASS